MLHTPSYAQLLREARKEIFQTEFRYFSSKEGQPRPMGQAAHFGARA